MVVTDRFHCMQHPVSMNENVMEFITDIRRTHESIINQLHYTTHYITLHYSWYENPFHINGRFVCPPVIDWFPSQMAINVELLSLFVRFHLLNKQSSSRLFTLMWRHCISQDKIWSIKSKYTILEPREKTLVVYMNIWNISNTSGGVIYMIY